MSPNCRNFVAFLLSINFIHEKYHLMSEIISNTWNYLLFFIIIIVHTTGDSIFRWFVLVLELRNVQRVKSSPYNQENLVKILETSYIVLEHDSGFWIQNHCFIVENITIHPICHINYSCLWNIKECYDKIFFLTTL